MTPRSARSSRRLHDRVRHPPDPSTSTSTTSPGSSGREFAGVPEQDVARLERDEPREVGQHVRDRPEQLARVSPPARARRSRTSGARASVGSTSAASTSPGPIGQEPVLPFTRASSPGRRGESRGRRRRSPPRSRPRSRARPRPRALHVPPDHDGDLALVVQVPAAARAHDLVAVSRQRRRRLQEVRRIGRRLRRVLLDPARIAQVDGDDLGRRQLDRPPPRPAAHRRPCSRTRTRSPCRPRSAPAPRNSSARATQTGEPSRTALPDRRDLPRLPPAQTCSWSGSSPASHAGKSRVLKSGRRVDRRALLREAQSA